MIAILGFVNLNATNKLGVSYLNNDAVTFVDRGVEFHVFLNGEFDFNALHNNTYYRNTNVPVLRDNFGRIRQVGRTIINYGAFGNVSTIGNIPIRYRFGQLASVGNLVVEYDRWGYPHYRGFVRNNVFLNDGFTFNVNFGNVWRYDDPFFYDRHFRNSYRRVREDANFFYYRAIPNARLGNRSALIKRRKPTRAVVDSNRRYLNNRANTTRVINNRTVTPNRKVVTTNRVDRTRNVTPNRKVVTTTRTVKTTPNNNKRYTNNRSVTPNKKVVTTTRTVKSTPTRNSNTRSTTVTKRGNTTKVKKTVTTTRNTNTSSQSKRGRR